ncbi:anti-phage-associated DUF1156 domain-containing protein [Glaciimonas sp. GG7]
MTSTTAVTTIPKIDYTTKPHPSGVIALSLKDTPSLIEALLPVQKLSIDVYKERMAGSGQTLTALGSYWKGRKPLVLNRACVLAALLPATDNPIKDLEVFELLMGMDEVSMSKRIGLAKPAEIAEHLVIGDIGAYFKVDPPEQTNALPIQAPFDIKDYTYLKNGIEHVVKLSWRDDVSEDEKHELAAGLFDTQSYKELASDKGTKRAEEIADKVSTHIWPTVNAHLSTKTTTFAGLVEQLGVMRYGHRPTVADTFSGSGQIPFAAAQLGCDVYASDLNPVACMLTWGAFNIVGATVPKRREIEKEQKALALKVRGEIDALGIETDGAGWRGKVYLYCLEVTCPSSGWKVPVLPSFIVSKQRTGANNNLAIKLVPDYATSTYAIELVPKLSLSAIDEFINGTYRDGNVVHTVNGVEHINALTAIRGDYTTVEDGKKIKKNMLRMWDTEDVVFLESDIFQERLYAIQWIKDDGSPRPTAEFRSVTQADLAREDKVTKHVQKNIANWQIKGWVPDTRIEPGDKTDEPIRTRGWTHWHHLFNPRQLLIATLFRRNIAADNALNLNQILNWSARLSRWNPGSGGGGSVQDVFYNQALNTLFNYGCRGMVSIANVFLKTASEVAVSTHELVLENIPVSKLNINCEVFITDPPYGDAVKYEEILEFFIAWLRKTPPAEFADWTWDSRRELAVKGEDHNFRLSMVAAYKRMAECMPDNGLQILMFTHQDGNIWADMANIVWASGLRVTAAWYLVTETDSALREGSYVKGTILLVLRKRLGAKRTNQTDLSYELEDEVAEQIKRLTGLNDTVAADSNRAKDGNLFEDADLQMAGYAAALKVLTKYSVIDGKDMTQEALRPRVGGQETLVDGLIEFAVNTANKALVPHGLPEAVWHDLNPSERFYLKMLDMESQGIHGLDNYQNFAKAFSVKDWKPFMESEKASAASLRSAKQFARSEMNVSSGLFETPTRAVLYALMDLQAQKDIDLVLKGLEQNLKVNAFYSSRVTLVSLSKFIAKKVEFMRPEEAAAARILAGGLENQRM